MRHTTNRELADATLRQLQVFDAMYSTTKTLADGISERIRELDRVIAEIEAELKARGSK